MGRKRAKWKSKRRKAKWKSKRRRARPKPINVGRIIQEIFKERYPDADETDGCCDCGKPSVLTYMGFSLCEVHEELLEELIESI